MSIYKSLLALSDSFNQNLTGRRFSGDSYFVLIRFGYFDRENARAKVVTRSHTAPEIKHSFPSGNGQTVRE